MRTETRRETASQRSAITATVLSFCSVSDRILTALQAERERADDIRRRLANQQTQKAFAILQEGID